MARILVGQAGAAGCVFCEHVNRQELARRRQFSAMAIATNDAGIGDGAGAGLLTPVLTMVRAEGISAGRSTD